MLIKRRNNSHLSVLPHVLSCQIAIFVLLISAFIPLIDATNSTDPLDSIKNDTTSVSRNRRQLYGDDYYGSYYGWQAGRIVGWILGFIVLLLIICVPCVCCIGIWFAGWFGVRQAMARKRRAPGTNPTNVFSSSGGVIRRTVTDPPSPAEHRVVYAQATDRYFERRPRSPQAHASTNTEYRR